jgi:hypothetical protein
MMSAATDRLVKEIGRLVDARLGVEGVTTAWARDRYLARAAEVIGEIEISMNSVKERDFADKDKNGNPV